MAAEISVRTISSAADLERAFALRRLVFIDEQHVSPDEEFDADDPKATHVLAEMDGVAVGTGRLVLHTGHARIGRMAVCKERRGEGVGRAVLEELIRIARAEGATRLVLHAQVHAIGFYAASGFRIVSEEFQEAGIPHRVMARRLDSSTELSGSR